MRMQWACPALHRKKPTVESFHVQTIQKVGDAPLVVHRQVPAGQQSDVLVVPHQKGSHDPVGAATVEVPQSSVIDRVTFQHSL